MRPVTDLTKRVSDIGQQAAAAHAYTTYGADHGVGGNGRAQGPYPYTSPPEYQHYTPNSAYQRRRPEDDGAYAGIAGQTLRSPLNYGAGPQGFGYKAIHAEGLDEGDRRGSDWSRSTSATRVNEDEYDYAGHGSNQSKRVSYGSAGGGEVYNDRRDDAVDRDRGDEQDDDEESDHGSDHAHDHDDRSPKAPKLGHGLSPSTAVKRDFAGRRKIKGTKGIDLSLEAGKLVFDKCTRMDAKYRQPRMVILESIKETETYKAIQDRSANSLAKAGTSDRYKDRTQSLLDLLEDNGIIWGKVLKAGNHPGGGPCGSCEHYDRECIVPLKKVMPEYPGDTGYRILSICIHCKLYHTCDLNSSVEYKPTSKAIKIVNTTRIKSRGNRPEEDAIKEEPASPARPAKRSAASSSTPKDRPKAALPSRSSKPPARTASAPATAPTRVSTRIQARRDTIRFDADLEPSDADEEDEEGQEEVVEASEQEEAETKKGGKSGGKATQKGSRGSSAAPTRQDGMHDRLESIREFIAEMKEREKGRTKGRVDYATRVMFDKAEEDVEVLAALPKTSVYGGSRIEF